MDRVGELARLAEVGRRGLHPDEVGVRRVGEAARDRRLDAAADAEEALRRALARQELVVALVDVARQELRGVGVRAGDQQRRHAGHVGREPRGEQRPDELAGRDEHLAAEVAALLLRRELVLEVHGRRAGLDHPAHQLERVERPAEAGLRVGDDREEVVDAVVALGPLDLVGAQQRVVQPPHHRRHAVRPGRGSGRDRPAAARLPSAATCQPER